MAQTMTNSAARVIGKYRLLHELEIGRAGGAYIAEDASTRRRVVVRLLPGMPAADFTDEAKRLMRLEHDHIATLIDFGQTADGGYLVTDLLKGEVLNDRLKREHRLPLKEALRIAREIAAGLAFVHSHGIIHRDISPANIWLEPSGRVRLLGLGASRPAQSLLNRLDESGTPGYLSPEQASGEEVTAASDLFSLGCLLYQMSTGEKPFRGEQSTALARAVIFEHPAAARQVNPDIPEPLDELISRLLAKMPSERPTSAEEVEERLREWLDPVVTRTRPRPIVESLSIPASRRILETIENLKAPERPIPFAVPIDGIVLPEQLRPKRNWFGDVLAAILLVAGGIGLYLWWKASNERPAMQQPPAIKSPQRGF